jgi:hypothetical protein
MKQIERRLSTLESNQPPQKSRVRRILEKCTDAELDRIGQIADKVDGGGTPTAEESAFLDAVEAKYGD